MTTPTDLDELERLTDTEAKAREVIRSIRATMLASTMGDSLARSCAYELERALEREARHAAELREQAERFSEAVDAYGRLWSKRTPSRDEYNTHFAPFILPAPDPLVEAIKACNMATLDGIEDAVAHDLRVAMQARGYEWRKIGEVK